MEVQTILSMTVVLLRDKLRELNLPITGRKQELRHRLLEHFQLVNDDDDEEGNGDTGTIQESNDSFRSGNDDDEVIGEVQEKFSKFTLKDLKDSLTNFDGAGSPKVESWMREFEETANTVKWNKLQKFVYAKQLLRGAAKSFVRGQEFKNWTNLRESLLEEFKTTVSAIDIHSSLKRRRKKHDETLREYLYALIELGKPIALDAESVIRYFADGVPDVKGNKTIFYQAKSMSEVKEAIRVYEAINKDHGYQNKPTYKPNKMQQSQDTGSNGRKCFKCGETTHLAKDCKSPSFKCFKCGKFGHKSFECHIKKQDSGESKLNTMQQDIRKFDTKLIFKNVKIKDFNISALVDTGCDLNLIRYDTLMQAGDVDLSAEHVVIHGVKDVAFNTLGSFSTKIKVDDMLCCVKFHVVRERDLQFPVVLGNEMLKEVDMLFKEKGVVFLEKEKETTHQILAGHARTKGLGLGNEKDFNLGNDETDMSHVFHAICASELEETEKRIDLDLEHLDWKEQEIIQKMVNKYEPKKVKRSPVEMKIVLTDDVPVYQVARRISPADKQVVEEQVENWLNQGIIQPSVSEYASPVLLVGKKDNTKRLCCDYRRLNEKILRDNFPVAVMDDVIEKLTKAKVYITLDLQNGYFHVPVAESSRKYTAFVTHHGQFEFLFVPFGISNSPAVFARFIQAVFRDLVASGTLVVYVDDIIIPAIDKKECIQKFDTVLERAAEYNLKIKWSKSQFLKTRVNFLGYIVEDSTIQPSTGKVSAVKNFPVPINKQTLQRFLGMTSFFRRFIEGYAHIAKPLSDLLRKDKHFYMGDEQLIAFEQLKAALINAPVLKLYNPEAETEVHADASMYGYGAALMQKDSEDQLFHPVQYMSRKTSPQEEKYHSYELEVLAIIEALKKWRIYLMGLKFTIVTDCNAFAMTMNKKEIPLRVSRWAMYLQDYEYKIVHRSGTKMRHVDALSRISCLILQSDMKTKFKNAQQQDQWLSALKTILEKDTYKDFVIKGNLIYKDPIKELLVVPASMEDEIIRNAHRQGHLANKKTQEYINKTFYIPKLEEKVDKIVKNCVECIIMEGKRGKKEGLLDPIAKDDKPLNTYHLDHVGPLEATKKRYNHILVIVDGFTKFVWLYPTRSTDAQTVVENMQKQAYIFGNPRRVVTDRGTAFTAKTFLEYCKDQNIQHLTIATGVPRGNGQVERMHKILVPMLAKFCHENPKAWYKHIDKVQQIINNTPPRSTKYSPFRLLTGIEMRVMEDGQIKELLEEEMISELDEERNQIREIAKQNIAKIQEENRKGFNRNRKIGKGYEVNDMVAIQRTQFGTGMKLRPKFLGPYIITKKLPHGRYEVNKVGQNEGSNKTVTVEEYMKKWERASGSDDKSGGPSVGRV